MPSFEEDKHIFIDPEKLEEIIINCTNRHIGRIMHSSGDLIPEVIKSLVKKEMWFCAENILQEGCGLQMKSREGVPYNSKRHN